MSSYAAIAVDIGADGTTYLRVLGPYRSLAKAGASAELLRKLAVGRENVFDRQVFVKLMEPPTW